MSKTFAIRLTCDGCGETESAPNALKRCSTCKKAHYCSQACQRKHWRDGHKDICGVPSSMVAHTRDETAQIAEGKKSTMFDPKFIECARRIDSAHRHTHIVLVGEGDMVSEPAVVDFVAASEAFATGEPETDELIGLLKSLALKRRLVIVMNSETFTYMAVEVNMV